MRNYMMHLIRGKDKVWWPKYYNPEDGLVITGNHVCRFHDVMLECAQPSAHSMEHIWSMRSVHKANAPVKECMPQDAFKDFCRCMHFADNWEEEDDERRDEIYSNANETALEDTTRHH